jgi:hypothetical protein
MWSRTIRQAHHRLRTNAFLVIRIFWLAGGMLYCSILHTSIDIGSFLTSGFRIKTFWGGQDARKRTRGFILTDWGNLGILDRFDRLTTGRSKKVAPIYIVTCTSGQCLRGFRHLLWQARRRGSVTIHRYYGISGKNVKGKF